MKPIGSEKLTGMDKIQRIIEIAQYGTKKQNVNESTTEYSKLAVDGNTYAIVKEKDGYYVKVGLNESSLDYVDGILNKNKNRFSSYSGALKKINLMLKPLNETLNDGKEDPVLNETKYVLKKPVAAPVEEPVMDAPVATEPEADEDMDFSGLDLGMDDESTEPELDMDMDMDMGDEESTEEPTEEPSDDDKEGGKLKKVQKLTGKLGQALRDMKIDLESSDIKYVLNSIISAVDLTKLNEEDLEGVMENFEELDSFEISSEETEDSEELAIDDMDLGLEDMEDESSEEELEEDMLSSDFDNESTDEKLDDYRPMSDRDSQDLDFDIDGTEGDLDEGAFLKGLGTLGSKFVNYYKNNPEARKMINSIGATAVAKGTDKMADELDKTEKIDKEGKASETLKGFNPSEKDIDTLGNLIFGDLNEDEVSTKIDNVLGKYFK